MESTAIPRHYLAFDIEIAKVIPGSFDDWKDHRPLGISCAATLTAAGDLRLWYGVSEQEPIAGQMSQAEVAQLVEYLQTAVISGHTILTWNGLAFDFDVLAEESGLQAACRNLAIDHVDMMFHVFCHKGFPLALDKAAKGMGLPGKSPGMSGEMAPIYWNQGLRRQVLDYVAQDARTTLELAQVIERQGELRWISNRGAPQFFPLTAGWLTVRQALALPEPDTSWMARPWPRRRFTAWLGIPSQSPPLS
ncbi:MAG TPA: ribonuclease H-like domain-containing protein, partial [Anaerolineales bacterium]|nr:ribonuclease H-like domain-containing protein [Anaerolineales bacterium]